MKQNHSARSHTNRILVIIIIISFIGAGIRTLSLKNAPVFIVSAQDDTWTLALKITESSGKGTTVILKTSPEASDGQDTLDIPIPPPPLPPYVRAWFTTPLSVPFNTLLNESKHSPSQRVQWNLSLIWVPESENDTLTTIDITWNSDQAIQSTFDTFQLYQNDTVVANLLTENSYSFQSNGTLHRFQIIGLSSSTNGTTEQSGLPVLPILLGIAILIIIILIAVFIYYKRKERRRMEEMEEEKRIEEEKRKDEERRLVEKREKKKKRKKKEAGKKI